MKILNKENPNILEINTIDDLSFFFLNDDKPLIIEIENLSELEILLVLDSVLKDLNKNYLSILSKKMLTNATFENLDIIFFCNRRILNRDNTLKVIFKNTYIDYRRMTTHRREYKFSYDNALYFEEDEFHFALSESSKKAITIKKSIKSVFINDISYPKLFPKKIITELLENKKVNVLKIKKKLCENNISYIFYEKKII